MSIFGPAGRFQGPRRRLRGGGGFLRDVRHELEEAAALGGLDVKTLTLEEILGLLRM
jgi:hypothetical protein